MPEGSHIRVSGACTDVQVEGDGRNLAYCIQRDLEGDSAAVHQQDTVEEMEILDFGEATC